MNARERLIETLQTLNADAILRLYDAALDYSEASKPRATGLSPDMWYRCQRALAALHSSLSDEISAGREDRC